MHGKFYTSFIVCYILFALLLYDWISILQYADEFLTLILVFYYILKKKAYIQREFAFFLLVVCFYIFYSIGLRVNSYPSVFYDLQQQIKPYLVFYCTLGLAPCFTKKQMKLLKNIAILAVFCSFLIFVPYYWEDVESASLATSIVVCSLLYYFFSTSGSKNKIMIFLFLFGIISGKSKFYGELIIAIYLFLMCKHKLNFSSLKTYVVTVIAIVVILFSTWQRFSYYYIDGFEREDIARPMLYKTGGQILIDYFPCGSGLGTFANEASRVFYSPLYYKYSLNEVWGLSEDEPGFIADAFYPTLTQIGFIGILFFLLFWYRKYLAIRGASLEYYKLGMMIILFLFIESVADSTYLSNRGLLLFLLLALVLNSNKNTFYKKNISTK